MDKEIDSKKLAKEAFLNFTGLKGVQVAYKYKKHIAIGFTILFLLIITLFINLTSTANPIEGYQRLSEVCPDVTGAGLDYVFGNSQSTIENCASGYATENFVKRAE